MPSINTKFMGEVPITYPNINIQRNIVAVLNSLDEKIQLNTEINRNFPTIHCTCSWARIRSFPSVTGIAGRNAAGWQVFLWECAKVMTVSR